MNVITITLMSYVIAYAIRASEQKSNKENRVRYRRALFSFIAATSVAVPLLMVPTSAQAVTGDAASAAYCQSPVDLTSSSTRQATLRDIRLGLHSSYDRVVLDLNRPVGNIQAGYVPRYVRDGKGDVVALRGTADFKLRLESAVAHNDAGKNTVPAAHRRQFRSWPSLQEVRLIDDFEGVVGVGVGLRQRVDFRVFKLDKPDRIVIDFARPKKHPFDCRSGAVKVTFFNEPNFVQAKEPYFTPVWRRVATPGVAAGALHSLFHGPTAYEEAAGLRLLNSEASGFTKLSIRNKVARVQLTGGCDSHGSTVTIAGEIMPILKQFPSVRWVKIYDPAGHTERPTGNVDSIPVCLEP